MKLTIIEVLSSIHHSAGPWSNYIIDRLHRDHSKRVAAGAVGHPPSAALIRRRLNQLAALGLVTRSEFTKGYYGYRWDITDAGRLALVEVGE